MSQAKDGAIILCHDLHGSTVDAMEMAIPALIEKGYQLVTVSQLLTSQGGEVEAGKVYYNR
jgi:peptidoglycan/xylan/chitin deacetylase (PgdA/CDA1 family)